MENLSSKKKEKGETRYGSEGLFDIHIWTELIPIDNRDTNRKRKKIMKNLSSKKKKEKQHSWKVQNRFQENIKQLAREAWHIGKSWKLKLQDMKLRLLKGL